MTEPRLVGARAIVAILVATAVLAGCAGSATDPRATSAGNGTAASHGTAPSGGAAASSTEASAEPPLAGIPTACLTLAEADCLRAREVALALLEPGDPDPVYVQVGPFGCATGDRCPATLAARPEGDVVVEFPGGQGINVHLTVAADGAVDATRDAAMGVAVEPASAPGLPGAPLDFALGHCGIFSGIDLAGSWWDPVGQVAMDSGDAVDATPGVITLLAEDTATFVAPTGFAIQLLRRDGPKLLPLCM